MNELPRRGERLERAVVIGGSIAGLLAARVVAPWFRDVIVVEKDAVPEGVATRQTVPQEHHVHLLLQRGKAIMDRLFPGFLRELEDEGAVVADLSHDILWFQAGVWKSRWPTGIEAHYCTRTLVEALLRRRLRHDAPNVRLVDKARIAGLGIAVGEGRITSTELRQDDGVARTLPVNLVVDAAGRGSRMPQWLEQLGYPKPEEELVAARLGYVSRLYQRSPDYQDKWKALLVFPKTPQDRRLAVISPIEGDRWLVTAGGWLDAYPAADEASFLAFLQALPVPDAYDVVSRATPAGDLKSFKMTGGVRRRYERLPRWPEGLVVLGDALCNFNPLYSQGMSVCAITCEALEAGMPSLVLGELTSKALQSRLSAAVDQAWDKAKASDARFPEIGGAPGIKGRALALYFDGLTRATATHRDAMVASLRVTNLLDDDRTLFRPRIAMQALAGAFQVMLHANAGASP